MQNSKSSGWRLLCVLAVGALLMGAPDAFAKITKEKGEKGDAQESDSGDTFKQLTLFSDVLERTRADYVDPVTDEKLIEAAINGMLSSLDPHSGYLNKKSFQEM